MHSSSTGVAVIITHHQKILIGLRLNTEKPCWQLPGGFMQLGETPNQAILRQSLNKTYLTLHQEKLIAVTNNVFCDSNHTVSLIFQAKCKDPTKLINREQSQRIDWHWESWDQLPSPLFLPLQTMFHSGYHPFASKKRDALQNNANNCFIF